MNLLLNRQIKAANEDIALIPGENLRQIINHIAAANEYVENSLSKTKIRLWLENLKGYEPQAISGAAEQYLTEKEKEMVVV